MADKPKADPVNQIQFDCCGGGTLRIHKDLLKQMMDGVQARNVAAEGPNAGFLKFSLEANPAQGVLKPTLTKDGSGKSTTFTFTIDIGPGDGKEC